MTKVIDRLKKPVEIHCHQDFGLGVANTIAALAAGASVAHTTVTGLGERAGNVPMEDVVMSLLCLYGIDLGIHTEKFCEVSRFVMDLAKVTQPPNRPIVGEKLYEVESGIIAGWIRMARKDNPLEFVPFAADLVGQKPVQHRPRQEQRAAVDGRVVREAGRHGHRRRADGDAPAGQGEVVREEGSADGRRVQGDRRARAAEGVRVRDDHEHASATVAVLVSAMCAGLDAQWLKQPTAGIPRTADGKPNLTAARAARRRRQTGPVRNVAAESRRLRREHRRGSEARGDFCPAADALYKQRMEDLGKDDPATFKCLPSGPRAILGGCGWARIIQTPSLIAILYEDLIYRQIHLDGRELPKDPNPSFMGYSVGRWDGDTLVVESIGFNETTWLDGGGHPHSEALRVTERFRRKRLRTYRAAGDVRGSEVLRASVDHRRSTSMLVTDTEMLEYVCNENEKDHAHLVGKASDEKKDAVKVAPQVLSRYVGTLRIPPAGRPEFRDALQRHAVGRRIVRRHRRQGQAADDSAVRDARSR